MVKITSYFSSWEELESSIKSCTRCILHKYRKNAVPGEGSKTSLVMFIGEAPGATEDELGRPFVGAAGRLLTMILESLGIKREQIYITNVVKCRPPQNREPEEEEVESCSIYLESQLLLLKPKLIVTLGNVAGKKIFSMGMKQWEGVMKTRGKIYVIDILGLGISVLPTIHPAAALYNNSLQNILINDLKQVVDVIREAGENKSKRDVKTLLDYLTRK